MAPPSLTTEEVIILNKELRNHSVDADESYMHIHCNSFLQPPKYELIRVSRKNHTQITEHPLKYHPLNLTPQESEREHKRDEEYCAYFNRRQKIQNALNHASRVRMELCYKKIGTHPYLSRAQEGAVFTLFSSILLGGVSLIAALGPFAFVPLGIAAFGLFFAIPIINFFKKKQFDKKIASMKTSDTKAERDTVIVYESIKQSIEENFNKKNTVIDKSLNDLYNGYIKETYDYSTKKSNLPLKHAQAILSTKESPIPPNDSDKKQLTEKKDTLKRLT